jgi:hypothetical protein
MATKSTKSSGAAASRAPATTRAPGASGPPPAGSTTLTGKPPATRTDTKHGGRGTDTGPVVEHTGGGLAFERQRSGTRAQPTKEQPTTPERAEIIEARRLELEINKTKQNPAHAAVGHEPKVGDRVRVLRAAATGWEMGTIKYYEAGAGSAELDGGEVVPLELGRWEPFAGALLAPERAGDSASFRQDRNAALVPDRRSGERAKAPEGVEDRRVPEAKSSQKSAKPARARQRTAAQKAARRASQKAAKKAAR